MERIITMIIRRFAMRALRGGLNRSKPNTRAANKPAQTGAQPQSEQQVSQARKLGRLVRRIGRF